MLHFPYEILNLNNSKNIDPNFDIRDSKKINWIVFREKISCSCSLEKKQSLWSHN